MSAISISKADSREYLTKRLEQLDNRHGVTVHLVRIVGQRWAYLAGRTHDANPMQALHRFELNNGYGAVVYGPEPVPDKVVQALHADLNNLIAEFA